MGESTELDLEKDEPTRVLFVGLQGSGKTTSAAKLAAYYQKRGYNPALVAADTFRPGAYEQLEQLSEDVGVPLYGDPDADDAVELAENGVEEFEEESKDVILIDSAGRHREEEALMEEMEDLSDELTPMK